MYFAIDGNGKRVFIDEVAEKQKYYCPVCKAPLIIKRGTLIAHHFAHKTTVDCDPWYKGKMSIWHKSFQELFPVEYQEIAIWNDDRTEYHIADIMLDIQGRPTVFEFQHSPLSHQEFIERTNYYLKCGFRLIWIFDFCYCRSEKTIFYEYRDEDTIKCIWPGNDRVKIFDYLSEYAYNSCFPNSLYILLHISTGKGILTKQISSGYIWSAWHYANPFAAREKYFVLLNTNYCWNTLENFTAKYFYEEDFYKRLSNIVHK